MSISRGVRIARRSFVEAITALMLLLISATDVTAGMLITNRLILHDGMLRWFDVYEPEGAGAGTEPLPILLLLHGGTQNKASMRNGPASEFFSLADREGFLVLVPNGSEADGTTGLAGSYNWNDCRGDAPGVLPETDDVGFISALLDWAEGEYAIDTQRVYATGASNGGIMSYRLAFELSDRLAAIGSQIANMAAVSDCPVTQPATPISVLIMNGTADPLVPPTGGTVADGRGSVISTAATRDFWRSFLDTDPTPIHTLYPEIDPLDAGRVESDLYGGGLGGTELLFYTVNEAGHNFPSLLYPMSPTLIPFLGEQNRDIESAEEVWAFLSRHQLVPEPGLASALWAGLLGLISIAQRRRRRSSEGRPACSRHNSSAKLGPQPPNPRRIFSVASHRRLAGSGSAAIGVSSSTLQSAK